MNISPQIRALPAASISSSPRRAAWRTSSASARLLDDVEVFVLDEADRMLDLGFVHEIKRIIAKLPPRRQSLLFSATMPPAIQELAASIVHQPARVEVTPVATTAERIEQQICFVDQGQKRKALTHFINAHPEGLVLVFVRMKHMANSLSTRSATTASRPTRSTATSRRPPASARWKISAPAAPACWSRPTSPRAAST